MPPTVYTTLETAIDYMTSLEVNQEVIKRNRLMRTRLRVKALNEIFNISEQVRQVAQSIYCTQPEVAGVFG